MKNIALFATALLCTTLLACSGPKSPEITDGWIRLAPPNAKVNAGYVSINNPTDTAYKVIGGTAEGYKAVELHMMRMNGGNMIMREVESFSVPAKGELTLSPGGDHLMLIGPDAPRSNGDLQLVTLQLKGSEENEFLLSFKFKVRQR